MENGTPSINGGRCPLMGGGRGRKKGEKENICKCVCVCVCVCERERERERSFLQSTSDSFLVPNLKDLK